VVRWLILLVAMISGSSMNPSPKFSEGVFGFFCNCEVTRYRIMRSRYWKRRGGTARTPGNIVFVETNPLKLYYLFAAGLAGLVAAGVLPCPALASDHPSDAADQGHEISGMWILPAGVYDINYGAPFTPAAMAARMARKAAANAGNVLSDDAKRCLPIGMPGLMMNEFAFEILESPGVVAILSENSSIPRLIHVGEKTLPDDLMPTWNGHSVGHWEGDLLVVDTTDFNDRIARIPGGGLPSTKLHLTEHIQLQDNGQGLADTMTFVDPVNLTKPWSHTFRYERLPAGSELWEYPCEVDAAGWKDRFAGETESK